MNPLVARAWAQKPYLLPTSLRRAARRAYRGLTQSNAFTACLPWLADRWQRVPPLGRASLLPVAVIAASIGGLFLPVPIHWSALSDDKDAIAFLNQAWTVTGASLGFVLVLIIFAFQAVAAVRPTVGFRQLAAVTPLLFVVYLGIATLLVDGLVLLHIGYQAPSKWAASWATNLSGVSIFLLAFLIATSLLAVDPQVLQRRRILEVRKRAIAAIEAEAEQRLALNLLIRDGERFGYEVIPLTSGIPLTRDAESARSADSGIVVDINLRHLRRAARKCADLKLKKPIVATYIGRSAGKGSRLVVFPEKLHESSRHQVEKSFKIKTRITEDAQSLLTAATEELHQEAMQAIGDGRQSVFQEVCQAQEQLLLSFPEAWAKLGQSFTTELAGGLSPWTVAPLDTVGRHLYTQAIKAIDNNDSELSRIATGLPLTVAARSIEIQAHALSDRMLSILNGISTTTVGSRAGTAGEREHMAALSHVTSFIDVLVFSRIENIELSKDERRDAIDFLSEAGRSLIDMMKEAADQGDLTFFDKAAEKWFSFGQFWLRDHSARYDQDPEFDLALATRNVLDRFRLSLCTWQIRYLWDNPDNKPALHVFTSLGAFDSIQRLYEVSDMSYDDPASRMLSSWILGALPEGMPHAIDTQNPLFRALALIGIQLMPTSGLELRASQWLLDNKDRLMTSIREVESASDLLASLGISDAKRAADVLRASIEDSANQQKGILEKKLLEAPIDQGRVAKLASSAQRAWSENRTMVNLMKWFEAFENLNTDSSAVRFGYRKYEPKSWYVSDQFGDSDQHGRQIGRSIAIGENQRFSQIIESAKPLRPTTGGIDQRIERAINTMHQGGYTPGAIFVPWEKWTIPSEFHLDPVDDPSHLGSQDSILGRFRELLVVSVPNLSRDRIVLADLHALAIFRQWTQGETGLQVSVLGFDEESALSTVRADRKLLRTPDRTRLVDRALELRKLVLVEVWEKFEIKVNDSRAARAVRLPPSFMRP